ncbi:hypothetical protein F9C07_3632 [Aspergillus flavus]|uniref:Uncharacterized protein n=1 Tax=Aspergillus flavus (strain ATCC 200026 / FGSC A1120 / IAM 13836 / NRRL 3357 / JCM 12722 / SRRC 167) TaxID=332952 RepID=A0A7U2MU59_ASPFN|nr:hypothetical protein F9C07_3632 [Aspergillus flavus]
MQPTNGRDALGSRYALHSWPSGGCSSSSHEDTLTELARGFTDALGLTGVAHLSYTCLGVPPIAEGGSTTVGSLSVGAAKMSCSTTGSDSMTSVASRLIWVFGIIWGSSIELDSGEAEGNRLEYRQRGG